MKDNYANSENDAVIAGVLMKTTELVRAWGPNVVKASINEDTSTAKLHIYFKHSDGHVIEVDIRDKLDDGRQFIDWEIYSTDTKEYRNCSVSTPEDFYALIDIDIAAIASSNGMEPKVGRNW